ncbi:cob(I)yrinic acid a,c-diamide adenosyltransferase [bacterium]|nr:cob(I)yrinic acid a,c-diamide adenosyltransferase [bacterium]
MKTTFFTGVGDKGVSNTGKKSISKEDPVFMLLGSLDECNSWLGLIKTNVLKEKKLKSFFPWLEELQEMLFVAQAEVASVYFGFGNYSDEPRKFPYIKQKHIEYCEGVIKDIDADFPPLKKFILPGGSEVAAQCDVARTVARKAERYAVIVSRSAELSSELLAFLNRLSSVLFAIARFANFQLGITENSPQYK